jgi:hypothetical protein
MIIELVAFSLGGLPSRNYAELAARVAPVNYGTKLPAPEEPKDASRPRQEGWEGPGRRIPGMPESAYFIRGKSRTLGDLNSYSTKAVNLPIKLPSHSGMGRKGRF